MLLQVVRRMAGMNMCLWQNREPEAAVSSEIKTSRQVSGSSPGRCKLGYMFRFFPTAVVTLTLCQKLKRTLYFWFFSGYARLLCLCQAEAGCVNGTVIGCPERTP